VSTSDLRIALCLSGQSRFLEEGYREVIYPFILENNNVDVFIHTWAIDENQEGKPFINGGGFTMGQPINKSIILDILNIYNPIKLLVQKQVPFEYGKYKERTLPGIRSDHLFSMFYSIYKSNELKKQYEKENKFKYDFVIRSRFDVKLNSKVDFTVDGSKLYLPNGCFDVANGYVDCFGYSNSNYMDVYADTFNHIDNIMNKTNIRFCGEYVLRQHLDSNNIPINDNYWHSLYR